MVFLEGWINLVVFDAHLKIFTRGHTQLSLCSGEEVLRKREVKDEEDEEDEDEEDEGDEGALASSSSVVRKSPRGSLMARGRGSSPDKTRFKLD